MSTAPQNPLESFGERVRSFWDRPEGKTGKWFLAGLVIAGGLGIWYKLLPYLISLAWGTVELVTAAAIAFALIYVLADPRFRALIGYIYKSAMRKLTGFVIELDPITIIKDYKKHLENNLLIMSNHMARLKGEIRRVKDLMTQDQAEMKANLTKVRLARDRIKGPTSAGISDEERDQARGLLIVSARKAERREKSILTWKDLDAKLEIIYRVLQKMYAASEVYVEDISDTITTSERKYEAIKSAHSALKAAMDILRGNSVKKEMYEQTMEFLANDWAMKVGEIEQFVQMSGSFLTGIDLENNRVEEQALSQLDEWEKRATSILLGDEKTKLIEKAYSDESVDLEAKPEKFVPAGRKLNLFDN